MKKYLSLIILLTVFIISCSKEIVRTYTKQSYSFTGKKNIAIVNINIQSRRDMLLVKRNVITEAELQLKQKGFSVLSQDQIALALKELNLPSDREYTETEIAKLREKLTCDIIIQGFVSEDSETLISEDLNINFHFKYYDGTDGKYVAESLYQYKGSSSILDASLVKTGVVKALSPLGIKD